MCEDVVKNKLLEHFRNMIVKKDPSRSKAYEAIGVTSFLRDWLTKKYADSDGNCKFEQIEQFVKTYLPQPTQWQALKARLVDGEPVRLLAKITVDIDIATGERSFGLSHYGLSSKDTLIADDVWEQNRESFVRTTEVWGQIELRYCKLDDDEGKIVLTKYSDFCPYTLDVDVYKEKRRAFTVEEWIDVVLGAVDYNPAGYKTFEARMGMCKRLLPFIEKNVNLIELAPKSTGKSYLYGQVSKNVWAVSTGTVSRAQLFYNVAKKRYGLVACHDCVILDEVNKMTFPNPSELQGALQGYLENRSVRIDAIQFTSDSGFVISGNIPCDSMDIESNMMKYLPSVFNESALIDRFHGFIEGWDLPRLLEEQKASSWNLNTEYFTSIMHLMRSDGSYRRIVDDLIEVGKDADIRHLEAVKRLTTGFLKLLFPHVQSVDDVDRDEFKKYCLDPAIHMRTIIWKQLCFMDREYRKTSMPELHVKE